MCECSIRAFEKKIYNLDDVLLHVVNKWCCSEVSGGSTTLLGIDIFGIMLYDWYSLLARSRDQRRRSQ
jgi:hypothetical protein